MQITHISGSLVKEQAEQYKTLSLNKTRKNRHDEKKERAINQFVNHCDHSLRKDARKARANKRRNNSK